MAQANSFRTSPLDPTSGPHFVVPVSASEPPQLRSLQSDIERIVSACTVKTEAIQDFLRLSQGLTNATDVAYAMRQNGELKSVVHGSANGALHSDERKELLLHWSCLATQTGHVQLNSIEGMAETIATLPIFVNGHATDALHAALLMKRKDVEPLIVSLQLIATGISAWHARFQARSNQLEANVSSAVIELIAKCNEASSTQQAHYVLVTELQKIVGCSSVAFAERARNHRFRIRAISATAEVDQKTNIISELADCAAEADVRESMTVWPPLSVADRHSSMVHRTFVDNHSYESILSMPIESDTDCEGILLFMGRQATIHDDELMSIVSAVTPHIAGALSLRKQAEAGPFARLKRAVHGTPEKRKTRRGLLIGLLLGSLAMMIPVPHKVSCNCVVEPTVKRFATVPFDGILQQSFVKPGDIVSAGQLLAKMDDQNLRFEKSEAAAARTQAIKEIDVHLAKGKVADAQISKFKATELLAKLNWIGYREKHLDIVSAIGGVVIEGDLEDAQGASVRQGQVLFEVAPLDSLKLTLDVPEEDIAFVREKMSITARLDGAPGKRFEASLLKIKPRASAERGENVFTAEASLIDTEQLLRPGMSGTAKVIGSTQPVGWILFHRAYRKTVDFIDW